MDFNNIEKLLREGTNPEDIANAFTKELNNAISSTKEDPLETVCNDLSSAWGDMLDIYCDRNNIDCPDDFYFSGKQLYDALPAIVRILQALKIYVDAVKNLHKVVGDKKPGPTADFDEVMADFLSDIM